WAGLVDGLAQLADLVLPVGVGLQDVEDRPAQAASGPPGGGRGTVAARGGLRPCAAGRPGGPRRRLRGRLGGRLLGWLCGVARVGVSSRVCVVRWNAVGGGGTG